jgi:hypothetical protein
MLHLAALGMRDVDFDSTIDAAAFARSFERAGETVNQYEKLNGVDSYSSTMRGFVLAVYASFQIKNRAYFAAAGAGMEAIKTMNEARALDSSNTEVNFFLGLYGYALSELKKKMWWALFWHAGDKAGGIALLEEGAKTAVITGDAAALALCDIYLKEKARRRARDVIYSIRRRMPKSRFVLWAEAKHCESERMYPQAAQAYGKLADSYEADAHGCYNAAATRNKQAHMHNRARERALAERACRRLIEQYKGGGDDKRIAAIVKDTEKLLEGLSK